MSLIMLFISGGLFTGGMAFIVQGRAFGFQNVTLIALTPAFFVGAISAVIISYLVMKNRNNLLKRIGTETEVSAELELEIIERERTEDALVESEKRYRQLIDRSPDAVFVHIDGKIVFVNSAMMDLMAAESIDRLIGMDAINIPHPDYRERVRQFRPGMTADHGSIDFTEMRYVTLDGRTIDTEAAASLIKWGGKDAFMVVARDISERKRVEQALIESEAKLRLILDTSMDAVIGMNSEGLVTEWSAGAHLMFGYAAGAALGRALPDLIIPPALRGAHSRGLNHFLATGEGSVIGNRTEITARRADGSEFPVELSIAHMRRDGDHFFSGFIRDITQRVQAEAEHAELENRLRQAQKMEAVGQLTGGIAHDFNNLLSVTLGNAEFLSEQLGDSKSGEMANAIVRAARRGGALTQRLLSFSRQQTLSARVIDVNSLIAGMTDMLGRTLGETIEIVTNDAGDPWPVKADPGELENALLNLAINARDAMPSGGSLILEADNIPL
ncbi:MAG: PAS domain S-box protein, partial [Rhodospirillales bacterium]|nr:PAS domain S-box protein [Rhodospirillales bacterium]